jgi:hypothetical protein
MRSLARLLVIAVLGLSSLVFSTPSARPFGTFYNVTIFSPPPTYNSPGTIYGRSLLLNQNKETRNVLLSTFSIFTPGTPYFPIYRSADGGLTWTHLSNVHDTVNGWGLSAQPSLFELPRAIGNYPAGTVLLTGNSIPSDRSKTKIDVYASRDAGKTWSFVSSAASGNSFFVHHINISDVTVPTRW